MRQRRVQGICHSRESTLRRMATTSGGHSPGYRINRGVSVSSAIRKRPLSTPSHIGFRFRGGQS